MGVAFEPGQSFDGETNEPGELFAAWQRPFFHVIPGRVLSNDGITLTYAPTMPGVPLEAVGSEGACVTPTIPAVPSMSGMGELSATGRIELVVDAVGEQVVTLECER